MGKVVNDLNNGDRVLVTRLDGATEVFVATVELYAPDDTTNPWHVFRATVTQPIDGEYGQGDKPDVYIDTTLEENDCDEWIKIKDDDHLAVLLALYALTGDVS